VLSAQSGFAANFLFELEHGTKGASFATIVKLADIFGVDISEFFKPLEKTSPLDFLADTEERAGKVLFFLCEQLTDWTEDITKGLSEGNETE
jgi:transcriptional regulator with XRE-family HTH domain